MKNIKLIEVPSEIGAGTRGASLGIDAVTGSPEALDQLIKDEIQLFKKLATTSGIKAD